MKKALTISCLCLFAYLGLTAQTNTFPASGNVGVGTTNPTQKLTVKNSGDFNFNTNFAVGIYTYGNTGSGTGTQGGLHTQAGWYNNDVTEIARFSALTSGYVDVPRMVIKANGNIGIGTTSPSEKLTVIGNIASTGSIKAKNYAFFAEGNSTTINIRGNTTYDWQYHSIYSNQYGMAIQPEWKTGGKNLLLNASGGGKVGIGTSSPDAKLTVKGNIHTNEVKVDLLGAVAPDYVFENDYYLKPLKEVENYISKEKHLPNIPSAKDMETNGILLKELNLKLLEKIEELTLYTIQQEKKLEQVELLKEEIKTLKDKASEVNKLKAELKNQKEKLQELEAIITSKK